MSAGTLTYNKGNILAKSSDTSLLIIRVDAFENLSHSGCFTVPKDYTAYITNIEFSEASNKGSMVSLWTRESTGNLFKMRRIYSIYQSQVNVTLSIPYSVPQKTDIELRAKAIADGAVVSASMIGWYEL